MNTKSINPLLLIGLIGVFTIGSSFFVDIYGAFFGNKDIYWTPQSMKFPIEDANNDFQVYISEKLLQKHLAENTLFAIDNNGVQYPVVTKDVSVRLNNWNKARSRILTTAIFNGFAFGITLTLFITGIIQTVAKKRKEKNC
jgi:hypothetical protein